MDLARIAELYPPPPDGLAYLNTATYGLAPVTAQQTLRSALDDWTRGIADWTTFENQADRARALFATLIHASPEEVALLPAASFALATALASAPRRSEIVLSPDDHPSLTIPAQAHAQNLRLRWSPFDSLADAATKNTHLIACSHVRHDNGLLADIPSIAAAAAENAAAVYLDATQSAGALAIDVQRLRVDYLACAAYKWLSCPRGVAFLWVAPHRLEQLQPLAPSRRSTTAPLLAAPIDQSAFSSSAAKLDVSLAWFSWAAAPHCLEAVLSIDEQTRERTTVGLAQRLAVALGSTPPQSGICAVEVADRTRAKRDLERHKVKATTREAWVRLSPHFYNSAADVDRAVAALAPHVRCG
jgi:selenocysteine lyase/cysteine desulfurase